MNIFLRSLIFLVCNPGVGEYIEQHPLHLLPEMLTTTAEVIDHDNHHVCRSEIIVEFIAGIALYAVHTSCLQCHITVEPGAGEKLLQGSLLSGKRKEADIFHIITLATEHILHKPSCHPVASGESAPIYDSDVIEADSAFPFPEVIFSGCRIGSASVTAAGLSEEAQRCFGKQVVAPHHAGAHYLFKLGRLMRHERSALPSIERVVADRDTGILETPPQIGAESGGRIAHSTLPD